MTFLEVSLTVLLGLLVFTLASYLKRRARIEREFARERELRQSSAIVRRLSNHSGHTHCADEDMNDFKVAAAHGEPCEGCGLVAYIESSEHDAALQKVNRAIASYLELVHEQNP